eukprot:gene33667-43332_t
MPPTLMGLRNADDDRVAKLKAALTGDGMSHKRLVPGVDSRGERGGYMNETVKIFPRYLIVSLMNQPYYRIPNALRSRATPHEAMKVPRGAVSTVCERARGSYITHFPQMSFDVPFGDAPQRLGERMRNPRANFKCEDAELLMSLRARHTVLVILYAVAVRLRVCRGPSMKEVKMRQRNFERVLERLGFTLEDPSRRLADLYSMAYAHTMHAAVWRALSSDRSLVDASARQFTPELFREVDKCAVCSSSVALYSFSTLVNSLMSKPIRMILFYAGQQCVQHGQEPLHPTDTALDDADADTRYCIIHSTFEAKASSVPPKAAQEVILKRFAASVVGYYSDARVARKHSTDKLESEYVEGLLNTLLTQPHKDARSDSLITPLRWVQEESGMSLAVTSSHVPEDPTTATLENDALDVHSIMRACVTSNVRCQRLLYNDHARTVGEGGRLTQLPQCPKHYDVPQHDAECAIVRVEEELDDDALLRQLVDAGVGVRDRNTLRADLEESLATVRAREEHAAPGQVVVTDTDARGGHAWNLDGPFVLEMSPEDFCCAHMERAVQPRFDARVPVHRHDPGVTNMGRRVERGGAERTAQELELDPTHVYRVPSRPGASAAAPRTFADDHALLQQMTTFRTQAPSAGQPSERRSDDDDDDDDAMDIDDLGDDAMETNGIIASTGVFDPHGWHDAMCKQASTEGERLISSLHIGSVVLNRVVAARRGSIERECGGDLPRARRRFDAAQDSWLRNWYMSLMSGELPMSVALKRATEPFIGMLSRDLRKNPGDRNSLNHPRAPYTYGWRLTSGMQYVAMTWEFMDRAVNVQSLHALAMQMHFCMSSVYCQKWKSNNKRLPHMWVCGVHQVGKSYVMEEVSRVTLPDAMRNLVTGQTAGSYFPSNQYTSCDEEHCTYFAELYNEMPPTLM